MGKATKLTKVKTERLKQLYYNPLEPSGLGGRIPFQKLAKNKIPGITNQQIRLWLSGEEPYSLHKPARKKFKRRRTVVSGINDQFQADLIDVQQYSTENNGIKFLLTVIDVFSKYAWCKTISSKRGKEVAAKLREVFQERVCRVLQTDKGTEFFNSDVESLLKSLNISHFTTENEDIKASIAERFNKTIQTKLHRWFTKTASYSYVDVLHKFVKSYNNSRHSSIGIAPALVTSENEEDVWLKLFPPTLDTSNQKFKFKIGDLVRISRKKKTFDKGYLANWSREVFSVKERLSTQPITYRIQDYNIQEIQGTFYELELQKVLSANVYQIESVLQEKRIRRQPHVLVKWKGYPDSMNSWIPKQSLLNWNNVN